VKSLLWLCWPATALGSIVLYYSSTEEHFETIVFGLAFIIVPWVIYNLTTSLPKADFTYINGVEKKGQTWAWKSDEVRQFYDLTFTDFFVGSVQLPDGTMARWRVDYQWVYGKGLDNTLNMHTTDRQDFIRTLYTGVINGVLVESCRNKATALSSFVPSMTKFFNEYESNRPNDEAGVCIKLMTVTSFTVEGNPAKLPTTYTEAMVREAMKRAEVLKGLDDETRADQVIESLKRKLTSPTE
jgi:hypothetical protein